MKWFLHAEHGYMLRIPVAGDGIHCVITSLCLNMRETEENKEFWERHKIRAHNNMGNDAICVDFLMDHERNPAFEPIEESKVPLHIQRDFKEYYEAYMKD